MLKRLFAIIFAIALLLSCTANISAAGSDKGTPLSEEMQAKENNALVKYNEMLKACKASNLISTFGVSVY